MADAPSTLTDKPVTDLVSSGEPIALVPGPSLDVPAPEPLPAPPAALPGSDSGSLPAAPGSQPCVCPTPAPAAPPEPPTYPSAPGQIGPALLPLFSLGFPAPAIPSPVPSLQKLTGLVGGVVGGILNQIALTLSNATIAAQQVNAPILANISSTLNQATALVSQLVTVVHDLTVAAGVTPPGPLVQLVQKQFPQYPYPGLQPPSPGLTLPSTPGVPPSVTVTPPVGSPPGPVPAVAPTLPGPGPVYPGPGPGVALPSIVPGVTLCLQVVGPCPGGPAAPPSPGLSGPAPQLGQLIGQGAVNPLVSTIAQAVYNLVQQQTTGPVSLTLDTVNNIVNQAVAGGALPLPPPPPPPPPPTVLQVYGSTATADLAVNIAAPIVQAIAQATGGSVNVQLGAAASSVLNALGSTPAGVSPSPAPAAAPTVSPSPWTPITLPTTPPVLPTIDQLDALIPGSGKTPFIGETFREEGQAGTYPLEFGDALPGVVEPPIAEPLEPEFGTGEDWQPQGKY